MAKLTDARNAVWDAILNWDDLQSAGNTIFKRQYRLDGDDSPEVLPSPSQLPAIMIWPDSSVADQVLNKSHELPYRLNIRIFTVTWNLDTAEDIIEKIWRGLWQSADVATPGTSYIRAATGFPPMNQFPINNFEFGIVGPNGTPSSSGSKVLITTIQVILRIRFNPQSAQA